MSAITAIWFAINTFFASPVIKILSPSIKTSDMAIGLGLMIGFRFPINFNYPYISYSITDFWRRWHISLSSWFKDYLYIPLGGNRVNLQA